MHNLNAYQHYVFTLANFKRFMLHCSNVLLPLLQQDVQLLFRVALYVAHLLLNERCRTSPQRIPILHLIDRSCVSVFIPSLVFSLLACLDSVFISYTRIGPQIARPNLVLKQILEDLSATFSECGFSWRLNKTII